MSWERGTHQGRAPWTNGEEKKEEGTDTSGWCCQERATVRKRNV